ncbi:MAG: FapA family protein [Desulfuromusa sp.]|nr:FapA family protein [Desulfuromusa sp.]
MSKAAQQLIDIGSEQIGEYVNDGYKLTLKACNNGLECRADITVYDKRDTLTPTEILTILRNHNIIESINLEQIAVFCSEAAQGRNQDDFLLAAGVEPVHGTDGWFELLVTTGKEQTDLTEDDSGRVDFKSVQTFTNVEPGQQIGNICLPTDGKSGTSITGEMLPPIPGKPCRVIAGSGVYISDDGTQMIAKQSGRAVFDNNGLSIAEEFIVKGDVDLSIGHISFNGFVDIKRDVLDDFNITATKGINVSGAVGACQIYSEGPVSIGSVAGLGNGRIICKGTFRARYLNQANVECWGDIHIANEVRNSTLKATGSICIPKGLVTGGELVALEGIEAKTIGSWASSGTHLTSGVYFPETDRLNFLRARVKCIAGQLNELARTLNTLNNKNFDTLRSALREATELRIGILTQRQVNLESEREEFAEELLKFSLSEHPTSNPKINVLGVIRDKVTFTLGGTSDEIPADLNGPASIIENTDHGGFRYLTYSELHTSAEDTAAIQM